VFYTRSRPESEDSKTFRVVAYNI